MKSALHVGMKLLAFLFLSVNLVHKVDLTWMFVIFFLFFEQIPTLILYTSRIEVLSKNVVNSAFVEKG